MKEHSLVAQDAPHKVIPRMSLFLTRLREIRSYQGTGWNNQHHPVESHWNRDSALGSQLLRDKGRGLQGSYHDPFDGEVLQASVPRGVEDYGQRLVGSLDVADLHFVLEGHREAAGDATKSCTWCDVDPPHLLATAIKNKLCGTPGPREQL